MSIDLEERIRRGAQLLDEESLRVSRDRPPDLDLRRVDERRSPVALRVAAVCLLLAGVGGMFWLATVDRAPGQSSPDGSTDAAPSTVPGDSVPEASTAMTAPVTVAVSLPADTTPGSELVAPVATLPPMADVSVIVPATVFGTGPSDWYRLQPDLDVAWYGDGGESSMLCFRTPAGSECQIDRFAPTEFGGGPIGIHSVGGQLLVVMLDAANTVTVGFDNGQVLTAPIERDPQIGWGVARVQLPDGVGPTGLSMTFGSATVAVPDGAPPTSAAFPVIGTAPPLTAPPTTASG